jgi:hypothetical protein
MNIRHAGRATADEWYEFPGDPDHDKPAYWVSGHATDHRLGDELIGYLTYAAQHDEGLPWPVATYGLVGVLTMATAKPPQTCHRPAGASTGSPAGRSSPTAPWVTTANRSGRTPRRLSTPSGPASDWHRRPRSPTTCRSNSPTCRTCSARSD